MLDIRQETGRVTRVVSDKGFGFIAVDGRPEDVFFHRSAVTGAFEALSPGVRVSFTVVGSAKGPRAEGVTVLA